MSERLFSLNTPQGAIEYLKPVIPRLPELVDFWGNYLEFWAQTGGMDNADPEELERAHEVARAKAEEILVDHPEDRQIAVAYSNMALHAAQLIRQESLEVDKEPFYA